MESVRNAFIAGPAATPTPTPTPTPTATATPPPSPPPSPSPVATPCGTIILSENFDGVIPPALPPGWVAANADGPPPLWVTSSTDPDTAPNDAFVDDPDEVSDKRLETEIFVPSALVQLRFRNSFNLEASGGTFWDGGVLEISSPNINAGVLHRHYRSSRSGPRLSPAATTPFSLRAVSTRSRVERRGPGNSNGYINTVVNLGPNVSGQTIKLRFRMGSDEIVGAPGWRIDTVTITDGLCPTPTPSATPSPSSGGRLATTSVSASTFDSYTITVATSHHRHPHHPNHRSIRRRPRHGDNPASGFADRRRAQSLNLSTRMRVETGDNVGIGGFIITGTAPKHLILRAIGPSLTQFGVPNVLADPVLELHGPGTFVTVTSDDWRDDPVQEALIKASGIPPTDDLESAIDATLPSGAYTAIVRGKDNTSGVALIEVYDLNYAVDSKLANISTRAFVSTGDDIVIGGFLLGGHSGEDRIVVRGMGPSLAAAGVPNVLANPTLELRDGNGALLVANNDWQDDPAQAAELIAANLARQSNWSRASQ